jgi:hypothetical protein
LSDILNYPEKQWKWYYVSRNPNIKLSDILKHPNLPWHWNGISGNNFLWEDNIYNKNLKIDIKARRKTMEKLKLFGHLEGLVNRYVGYV